MRRTVNRSGKNYPFYFTNSAGHFCPAPFRKVCPVYFERCQLLYYAVSLLNLPMKAATTTATTESA